MENLKVVVLSGSNIDILCKLTVLGMLKPTRYEVNQYICLYLINIDKKYIFYFLLIPPYTILSLVLYLYLFLLA